MIIEIAIGIILAVVVLACLPFLLRLAGGLLLLGAFALVILLIMGGLG